MDKTSKTKKLLKEKKQFFEKKEDNGKIVENSKEKKSQKDNEIPNIKKKSLIRFTIKAFKALAIAFVLVYQKPIRR